MREGGHGAGYVRPCSKPLLFETSRYLNGDPVPAKNPQFIALRRSLLLHANVSYGSIRCTSCIPLPILAKLQAVQLPTTVYWSSNKGSRPTSSTSWDRA